MRNNLKMMPDYKISLIDFNDSFSHNILSCLYEMNLGCDLVNYKNIDHSLTSHNVNIIILGPGPGHPRDYNFLLAPWLKKWLSNSSVHILGICLGHQIILDFLGFKLYKRISPSHGISKKILIPEWNDYFNLSEQSQIIKVQEYNSLFVRPSKSHSNISVDYISIDDEIVMAKNDRFISYQFHPESIGTENSDLFFNFIKRRLKGE